MLGTAASTDSRRRRRRRSATARTRSAASASGIARRTPRPSAAGRRCATSSTLVDRAPSDAARARTSTAPVDSSRRRGRGRRRRRPPARRCAATWTASTVELGAHQAELAKLELAERTLERTWLFLERGDATLVTEVGGPATAGDLQMRIVEAQEAERSRLAQEIHDGPAQALCNAIFQVEYIERVIESDPLLARTELRFLRELLRRELGDVRAFISQLRPPLLDELGLDGAIIDTVRAHAGADRADDHDRPDGAGRRARTTASRRSSCASSRRRCRMSASTRRRRHVVGRRPGSTETTGSSRSATTAAASTSEPWRPGAGATSASSSCASAPS